MRVLLIAVLITLPCAAQDADWAKLLGKAKVALKNPNPVEREEVISELGASNKGEAVDLLVEFWAMSTTLIRTWGAQRLEKMSKLDKLPNAAKFSGGNFKLEGDEQRQYEEWQRLHKEIADVQSKIDRETQVKENVRTALRMLGTGSGLKSIIAKMTTDKEWSMRAAAAEACAESKTPEARAALKAAIAAEKDGRVLVSMVDAVRSWADADAAALLGELMKKPVDWQVKTAAVQALIIIGEPPCVEALIEGLKDADGKLRDEINNALMLFTGVDKKGDYLTWKSWWAENKEVFLGGKYERPPPPKKDPHATTGFYGIPVVSKRVVFVLDRSSSMKEKTGYKPDNSVATGPGAKPEEKRQCGDRKIDVAKFELKRAVQNLSEGSKFNIIFYSNSYTIWMADQLAEANKSNKEAAIAWFEPLEPDGMTNIYDSVEKAFYLGDPKDPTRKTDTEITGFKGGCDTIFLISDGLPNKGQITDTGSIISRIEEINKLRRVTIHTIGVGDDADEAFLFKLADMTGGRHVMKR